MGEKRRTEELKKMVFNFLTLFTPPETSTRIDVRKKGLISSHRNRINGRFAPPTSSNTTKTVAPKPKKYRKFVIINRL